MLIHHWSCFHPLWSCRYSKIRKQQMPSYIVCTSVDGNTGDNYLNFLMNKWTLLMEDMPLETRHHIFFLCSGTPHFGHEVMAYFNECYRNLTIGCCSPIPWLPRSLDLTLLNFLCRILRKRWRKGLKYRWEWELHWIMDAFSYIRERTKMIQQAVKCKLITVVKMLCIYKVYLVKCSSECIWLILSFIFLCTHFESP
jgi:hypothetical protein